MFTITITALADGDFVHYETAATATTMEDRVTELHKEYPTTHFRLDVKFARRLVH